MQEFFIHNSRLGISLPVIEVDWDKINKDTQQEILFHWEGIRGLIPDRISEIEHTINKKQEELSNESDFQRSCKLNHEIADLASVINDLWLWYRTNQDITGKIHQ